jgi:hypothetical protein
MSLIKKTKKSDGGKLPGKSGKLILAKDHTGKLSAGKIVRVRGFASETEPLVEIVPIYSKCTKCGIFLADKETDLANELNYNCIECFEIEKIFSAHSMIISPIAIVSNNRRRK